MSDEEPIVVWHEQAIDRAARERLAGHRGAVVWFTGLSGSGKSTIANAVDALLHARSVRTYVLDGDNVRHGLNAAPAMLTPAFGKDFAQRFGLGFAPEDRVENIRRIGSVAKLFADAGIVTLTAFVSPYRADRDTVRSTLGGGIAEGGDFVEVFVDTPLEICEARDPKGLYKKARAGEIKNFTGIDDPYEAPARAELTLAGGAHDGATLAQQVVQYLEQAGVLPAR
ncbi:adenylyl-sulfate kinase [Botrimarina hoheduenensis]|uniref:Adenylyl-sulfate kinase n=1 Tax=Botrimarina hoheduenensis TaxID=2528000 RepID=A0A5C5VWZ8_9BACT|nr:adenylyl-sulfate kinase [Botrimarina hoheduenensis]TWT42463.1 Adenylyl-sulfate kinase [Botrimarina hoheduenensis]